MAASGFFTRTAPYRWALEPALGVLIVVVWGSAAVILGYGSSLVIVGLLGVAVAVSRMVPSVALIVSVIATIGTVVLSSGLFSQTPALALVFVSGCLVTWGVCLAGRPAERYVALAGALLVGALLTVLLLVTASVPGESGSVGAMRFFVELAFRLLAGFLLTAILVAGWVGALTLRNRADDRRAALPHREHNPVAEGEALGAEAWLMLPTPDGWMTGPSLLTGRGGFRPLSQRTLLIDVALAGGFVLFGLLSDPYASAWSFVVLAVYTAAVAVRRLSPALALALAWLGAVVQMLAGLPVLGSNIAVLVVLYATAAYADRFVRWAGLVSVGVGALLAAGYITIVQAGYSSIDAALAQGIGALVLSMVATFVASLAVLGLSWTLGLLMRTWQTAREGRLSQHRAVEEQRVAQRSVVVEQERNRIARDMHDVVAHSLAVVIAQADGARYARAQDPDAVDAALTTISTTARDALGDVRILLTRLRQDDAAGPQPVLADLDRLVAQMRSTGLDIDWTTTGTATTLGSGAQLAVYRIVQEALTNALRHGDAGRAVYLTLAWTDGWVAVTIDNAVRSPALVDGSGEIGHGLPGMRERALLAGGSLTAEAIGGRFIVAARLPAISTTALVRPVSAPGRSVVSGRGAQE